ncbi:hypothetical protein Bpfe_028227, partial [Biomphalaria pfeifferi]
SEEVGLQRKRHRARVGTMRRPTVSSHCRHWAIPCCNWPIDATSGDNRIDDNNGANVDTTRPGRQ